ncbi:MAG: GNAT family N-acetyltransferase [Proteobacteria bacterium]|nr:GNAT family N-acetyltransferase [Pseudomonadota bacterium]
MGDLKKMFDPETVVFVGADDHEGSIERAILDNLLSSHKRRLYAVNSNKNKVLHLDCRPTVGDIDDHIDLAVIVAPDESVLNRIEECAEKGVEGAVVISTGPRTSTNDRKCFEARIWEIRKNSGMRIIGPDSNGIILPNTGLKATFLKADPAPGSTAFISQSGTIGNAMLYRGVAHRIGFSMFISLGSMVDIDFADIIDFLQEDYFTKSIMLYVEHIRDAKKFLSASRCFARNKPIVVLKPGRYPQSAEALTAHAGRETGTDAVYDAAFKRVGIVRAKETEDFFDTAEVLVSKSLPGGARLAVITNSGGIGIIICDTLTEQKGRLAGLSEISVERLSRIIPGSWSVNNPLDILGDADMERYVEVTDICIKDEGVDGIIVVYAPALHCDPSELAKSLAGLSKKTAKPLIAVWMGGQYSSEGIDYFREAAVPVYETPEDAVRAYMYMYNYRQGIELLNETPEEVPQNEMKLTNHLRVIVRNAIKEGKEIFAGEDVVGFLGNYGIPVLKGTPHDEKHAAQENIIDEWALRCIRDVDFGAVILLISMSSKMRHQTGFAVGLPPLNRVLARRLMEEAEFPVEHRFTVKQMEETLINFSNLIADFPEFTEIEIESVVMADDKMYAKSATIQIDKGYQKGIVQYPHLVIMPYPSRYIMPWKLRDGRDVILRPLRAEDEPLIKEMMSSLSEETLRVRFFVVMEINHRMLMQFCNIDYDREIAFVAELKEGEKKRIIGGGRLIIEPDFKSGQFALLIQDDFHGKGLGEKFLDILIGIAQERELEEIYGVVLTENEKMLRVCRKFGFKPTKLPDGITRVSLELN